MNEQQGLSAIGVDPQQIDSQQNIAENPIQEGQAAGGISVEEVIQLLMSGKNPQELAEAGVPVEIIKQAIQIIQQQVQQQQAQDQIPQQGGLSQIGMQ